MVPRVLVLVLVLVAVAGGQEEARGRQLGSLLPGSLVEGMAKMVGMVGAGRQGQGLITTMVTIVMRLLGLDERQLGRRTLDMVSIYLYISQHLRT